MTKYNIKDMKLVCSLNYGCKSIKIYTNDNIYVGTYDNKYAIFARFENLLEELNTYGTTNFVEFESKFQVGDIWLFENELGFIIYKVDEIQENVIMSTIRHKNNEFLMTNKSFRIGSPMYNNSKLIFRPNTDYKGRNL